MAHLIDADLLLKKIKRLRDRAYQEETFEFEEAKAFSEALDRIFGFMYSLNQEESMEVDLEKEVTHFVSDDKIFSRLVDYDVALLIASHFYELGLNAKEDALKDALLEWAKLYKEEAEATIRAHASYGQSVAMKDLIEKINSL